MGSSLKQCNVCGTEFAVKFRRQIRRKDGTIYYICSQECADRLDEEAPSLCDCSVCGKKFELTYVYQQADLDGTIYHFCSATCRKSVVESYEKQYLAKYQEPTRIAVLNQKGGTGKTTSSVSIAAGLARSGYKVLIIDVDAQGHVGISLNLDINNNRTIYDIIVEDVPLADCIVHAAENLDVVVGNANIAPCAIELARLERGCDTVLRTKIGNNRDYDFIILDCGPSLSLINMNALTFADYLLIPVSCDFLSLVGVRQVLGTLKKVNQALIHPIEVIGILPTFVDLRNRECEESYRDLSNHFGEKMMPPIRVNTRIKEASSRQMTIFDYDSQSRGARDYMAAVDYLIQFRKKKGKQLLSA